VAEELKDCDSMIFLGKGLSHVIAQEGALKCTEITYAHCESFASGEVKHGPIALVTNDFKYPVFHIIPDDEHFKQNIATLAQLHSKDAKNIVITDVPDQVPSELCQHKIVIPSCGVLTPLLAVLPFQLLALYLGQAKGRAIDHPRNLAK